VCQAAIRIFLGTTAVLLVASFTVAAASKTDAGHGIHQLTVVEVKTPPIRWSCPTTSLSVGGRYPQVFHNGVPLRAVNAALRAAVLADERSLIAGGCPPAGPGGRPAPGIYDTEPRLQLISASSVVVSALMPAGKIPPGANFSYNWAAVTIRVATARQIGIAALFERPYQGLKAVAAAARARLSARNICVRRLPNPTGFKPTISNYRYFALTTKGLAIGFTAGTVAPRICGYFLVTLPYTLLRPYLGKVGRELIVGVRAAR
jgi:hypothetical protein